MANVSQGYTEEERYVYPRPINNWQQDQVLLRRYREALEQIAGGLHDTNSIRITDDRWMDHENVTHMPSCRACIAWAALEEGQS